MSIEKNTKHQTKLIAKISKEMEERKAASVVAMEEKAAAAGSTIRNGKKTYSR